MNLTIVWNADGRVELAETPVYAPNDELNWKPLYFRTVDAEGNVRQIDIR